MWDKMTESEKALVKGYLENLSTDMLEFAMQEIALELQKRSAKKLDTK